MPTLNITEPVLLIRIAKLFKSGMTDEQLYEATRGVWKLGIDREKAHYALSVTNGIVHEVYRIGAWQPAGTAAYNTRPKKDVAIPGRWEFTGNIAIDAVRSKYVGRSVADYFKPGNASPVNYVGIKSGVPGAGQ